MAIVNPPAFMQAGSYGPRLTRLAYGDLVTGSGVADAASFLVTPGDGMSVNIGPGSAYVDGDESEFQGTYYVLNEQTLNLIVPDNTSLTNSRTDMVYLIINDSDYSGSVDNAVVELAVGTPGNPPSLPIQPYNAIPLAMLTIAPSTDTITTSVISDQRQPAKLNEFMLQQTYLQPPAAFQALTPAANWVWDGGTAPTLGIRQFAGRVEFKGILKYTGPTVTTTAPVTICSIPTQYWPENSERDFGIMGMRYKQQTSNTATSNVSHSHKISRDWVTVRGGFEDGKLTVYNHASRSIITASSTQRIYLNGFWYPKEN